MIKPMRSARERCVFNSGATRPTSWRFLFRCFAVGALAGAPVFQAAAAQEGASPAPVASANPFATEISKLGVQKCAGVYSALGQLVSLGSDYTVVTQTEPSAPDAHTVQGVLGLTYDRPDHKGRAAGVILAAPMGGACEGQLVRIAPFEQSCADTVSLLPAGSTGIADLSGVPLYELGGNQGQALLVSSSAGCIVVTVARAMPAP